MPLSATPADTATNPVGYQNKTTAEGTTYFKFPFVGPTFECITDTGSFKLSDIKATGMKDGDYLYILNTDNGTPDMSTMIAYIDEATAAKKWGEGEGYTPEEYEAWIGWWKYPAPQYPDDPGEIEKKIDNATYLSGTAFLGNFDGNQEVSFTYSGAAQGQVVNVTAAKKKFPMFCNPIPRDVIFREINVSGMKDGDYIYKLNKNNGTPDMSTMIAYIDAATAAKKWGEGEGYTPEEYEAWIGWWKYPAPQYPDDPGEIERMLNKDTDVWAAGDSFIGNFDGDKTVVVNFPKAVPDKE